MRHVIPFLIAFSLGTMAGLMVYVIIRNLRTWKGRACIGMCLTFGLWAFGLFGSMSLDSESARRFWYIVSGLGWTLYPAAFFVFVMEMTGTGSRRDRQFVLQATLYTGLLLFFALAISPDWFIGRFEMTILGWGMTKPAQSPILLFCMGFMILTGIAQIWMLVLWRMRTRFRGERKQATLLATAGAFMLLAGVFTDGLLPLMDIPMVSMAPIFSIPWFTAVFIGAYRHHLLDSVPDVTSGEVLARVKDLMFLLSADGHIIRMNPAARDMLGFSMSEQKGLPVASIMPNVRFSDSEHELETELVDRDGGGVPVLISSSPRFNDSGDLVGHVVTGYDLRMRREMEVQGQEYDREEQKRFNQERWSHMVLEYAGVGVMLVNQEQRIRPEHSSVCTVLLGNRPLANQDLIDTLFQHIRVEERAHIREVIKNLFSEQHVWRLEALISLLPSEITSGDRLIKLRYIRNESTVDMHGSLLLVLLEDATERAHQDEKLQFENARLTMVISVLTNKDVFFSLLDEYRTWFTLLEQSWSEADEHPQEMLYDVYRNVHTFKGGFARFGLKRTVQRLMQFENLLTSRLEGEVTGSDMIAVRAHIDYESWLSEDLEILKETIGSSFHVVDTFVELDRNRLEHVVIEVERHIRDSGMPLEAVRGIMQPFRELYCENVRKVLAGFEGYIQKISRERQLPEPAFVVNGSEVLLDRKLFRPFFRVLVHVFNNIVAHAIELPEERMAVSKPAHARIECHVSSRNGKMILEIADDGRGIHPDQIRENMAQKQGIPVSALAHLKDEDVIQHVFEPGHSTALHVDTLAGRGIGLFAVAHATRQLGGTIQVHSRVGVYTRFVFNVPIHRQLPDRLKSVEQSTTRDL